MWEPDQDLSVQLKLYYGAGSCALAAMIALEQAGAVYEPIRLDLAAGDQRNPEYKAISPLGRVPTLVVGEEAITELIGVLTYVAASYPSAQLLPAHDPLQLAKAYEMLSWFSTSLHGYVAQILRGERFSDEEDVRERLKAPARRHLAEQLVRLDQAYAGSAGGLIGGRFTLVDAFSFVIWRWAERLGIDTSGMADWARAIDQISMLPAVQKALKVEAETPLSLPSGTATGLSTKPAPPSALSARCTMLL